MANASITVAQLLIGLPMLDWSKMMIQTKTRYSGPLSCGLDRGAEVPTSIKILLCPESHTAASDCNGGLVREAKVHFGL